MNIRIRQATPRDAPLVQSILLEAADWLRARGIPLWLETELRPEDIAAHIEEGRYFVAEVAAGSAGGEPAGTLRFDLSDPDFWPDVPEGESAFVHRLAVRRQFAGGTVSREMLAWAAERTRQLGRAHLRLDCDSARPRLRAFYEDFGFRYHSDRQVGTFHVARYELPLRTEPDGSDQLPEPA